MKIVKHKLPVGFTDKLVNQVPFTLSISSNNEDKYNYFLQFFEYTLTCEGKDTRVIELPIKESSKLEFNINHYLDAMNYALHSLFYRDMDLIDEFYQDDTLSRHPYFIEYAKQSFKDNQYSLIGRFDLAIDSSANILGVYEYNGDTPVMLFESLYQQNDMTNIITNNSYAQFNELFLSIQDIFNKLSKNNNNLVFASIASSEHLDDFVTAEVIYQAASPYIEKSYLLSLNELFYEQKGLTSSKHRFFYLNSQDEEIDLTDIFILYPWEDLLNELPLAFANWKEWYSYIRFYEPPYKWFMSHKGFMAYMTYLMKHDKHFKEKYGNIPLIPTYTYNHDNLSSYVEKPVLGRCGNNVTIVKDNHSTKYDGVYGDCPTIIQNLVPELIIDNRKIIGCIWTCSDVETNKLTAETLAFRELPADEFPLADNEYYITHIII